MRGTIVTIKPPCTPESREYDRAPTLDELRAAVGGGYIEVIPHFTTIQWYASGETPGIVLNCVAFCDEYGKLEHQPLNELATEMWAEALRRQGIELIDDKTKKPKDWLVGQIAIVWGDREFMAAL
jgi:hypothetical protein